MTFPIIHVDPTHTHTITHTYAHIHYITQLNRNALVRVLLFITNYAYVSLLLKYIGTHIVSIEYILPIGIYYTKW